MVSEIFKKGIRYIYVYIHIQVDSEPRVLVKTCSWLNSETIFPLRKLCPTLTFWVINK